jgi:hypothetical protein
MINKIESFLSARHGKLDCRVCGGWGESHCTYSACVENKQIEASGDERLEAILNLAFKLGHPNILVESGVFK